MPVVSAPDWLAVSVGTDTNTQFAMMAARFDAGAVVSMTGWAAPVDVPFLNWIWVEEFGISGLVPPSFKGAGICDGWPHHSRSYLHLLTRIGTL